MQGTLNRRRYLLKNIVQCHGHVCVLGTWKFSYWLLVPGCDKTVSISQLSISEHIFYQHKDKNKSCPGNFIRHVTALCDLFIASTRLIAKGKHQRTRKSCMKSQKSALCPAQWLANPSPKRKQQASTCMCPLFGTKGGVSARSLYLFQHRKWRKQMN